MARPRGEAVLVVIRVLSRPPLQRVATLAHHMHESVTASVAPSVNSDQGWDSSYQVDSLSASVLASLQLHPGHPAPLSVACEHHRPTRMFSLLTFILLASNGWNHQETGYHQRVGFEPLHPNQ
jgi:hypothetical protein